MRRRAGPVTFIERQIAHLWGGGGRREHLELFVIEWLLRLPVLKLSPVLGLISGMVFVVKAGIFSGEFYVQAVASFLTAGIMAVLAAVGPYDFRHRLGHLLLRAGLEILSPSANRRSARRIVGLACRA